MTSTLLRIGIIYSHGQDLSVEQELLAKYIALSLGVSPNGRRIRVSLIGVSSEGTAHASKEREVTHLQVPNDSRVIAVGKEGSMYDSFALESKKLQECRIWFLLLDAHAMDTTVLKQLQEQSEKNESEEKRIICSLQTSVLRPQILDNAFPSCTIVQGGVGFQPTVNNQGVLSAQSNGSLFVERLTKVKEKAVVVIDLLEAANFHVLSRPNIAALRWGCVMVRSFYYISAVTGLPIHEALRDRSCRIYFLQILHEVSFAFHTVMKRVEKASESASTWYPDSIPMSFLSIDAMMNLLPLPNTVFNHIILNLPFVDDFGLTSTPSVKSITNYDVSMGLTTPFDTDFRDVFELAKGEDQELHALTFLGQTVDRMTLKNREKKPSGDKVETVDSRALLASAQLDTKVARRAARWFILRLLITIAATVFVVWYFWTVLSHPKASKFL